MSHIHIPDGILPIWILLLGWLVTIFLLFLCIKRVKRGNLSQKLPYIGIVSALMIIAMMIEIVPIAYHFNLSVIAGIIMGPSMAFIAVFLVDLIIAMFGHGGITVIGLNTLVVGTEAVIGYYLFHFFLKVFKVVSTSPTYSAAIATFLSLIFSSILMIGFISISNLEASNLKIDKIQDQNNFLEKAKLANKNTTSKNNNINIYRFSKIVVLMSLAGWFLEALLTGFVIRYIYRIRAPIIIKSTG